jgi:hypothetical protein
MMPPTCRSRLTVRKEKKEKGRGRAAGGLKACWAAWSPGDGPVGLLTFFFLL